MSRKNLIIALFSVFLSITAVFAQPQIDAVSTDSAFVFNDKQIFATTDGGKSWREINAGLSQDERISGLDFRDQKNGTVAITDVNGAIVYLTRTDDGGATWSRQLLNAEGTILQEADLGRIAIKVGNERTVVRLDLAANSNFEHYVEFLSADGVNWTQLERVHRLRTADRVTKNTFRFGKTAWKIESNGACENFKKDCTQVYRIERVSNDIKTDVTPQDLERNIDNEKLAPGGQTRLTVSRGFDKCTAATVSQMQAWWDSSPFTDVNIYHSGRNRGCSQPQLTAAWVDSVTNMGWGLIPTVVGYQSPCSVCTTCQKHSSDPATAETQGRGEADIAIAAANNLGLTAGTVLYYDMERYDDTSETGACSTPTKAFLKGWTNRVKELGYISGVYGSSFNANGDWINMAQADQMDIVWLARWNTVMSVWGVAPLPDTYWTNHQRIHQWLGPRNETWGGVLFNIDNNISDARVAAFHAKAIADFDGDGKTDVSIYRPSVGEWWLNRSTLGVTAAAFGAMGDNPVPGDYTGDGKADVAIFRPSNGNWLVLRSEDSTFYGFPFGGSTDKPAPGDFDGDGKTDAAVYRASEGMWFISRSSGGIDFVPFGASTDIPVVSDFDGDRKSDVAIFRPSGQEWWIMRSRLGVVGYQFGTAGDVPVYGDYTGDAKSDVAVYRPSTGEWFILRSQDTSFYAFPFGAVGDVPAPGDYDGDGFYDAAVFRPSNGTWFLNQSTNGFSAVPFGASGDLPVPSALLPLAP